MTTNSNPASERLITLRNGSDMRVTLSERGAAMVSWLAPDRYGKLADVLLGSPGPHGYIAGDGEAYHQARWHATAGENSVSMRFAPPGAETGFPGRVNVQVHYQLDDEGRLSIEYEAVCNAPTPINFTTHPYFSLNGGSAGVGDHMLQIDADLYMATDAAGLPVAMATVAGTPFDFRQPAAIGPRLDWPDAQIDLAGGFDHCYCIGNASQGTAGALREVARVYDPGSGRTLQISTTETGLQFYSAGKGRQAQGRATSACANFNGFRLAAHAPAATLRPGQVYRQTTHYTLSLQR